MSSRRSFLAAGTTALALPVLAFRPRQAVDLVLRGATLFDGTGAPGREGDLAVHEGRITALGARLAERGATEIDLRGLALAPGFIDVHSHGDGTLAEDPRAESVVRQGITTIVVGQDGGGRPVTELADRLRASPPSVHVAAMVGLGALRARVVGAADRPPTAAELARMVADVEAQLAAGAVGVSTGLEYPPGGFATREELMALSAPLRARGLPYASHLRNEDDRLLESVDEALAIGSGAGCPVQISHLKAQGPRNWDKMGAALARIDAARARGIDAAFDIYPYVAYQTGLANLFPLWSRDGGTEAFLARLGEEGTAGRIRAETLAKVELIGGWGNVQVSGVQQAADRQFEGERMDAVARAMGAEPYAAAVDLLRRNHGGVGMVGFAMSEDNIARGLAHPLAIVCSDGAAVATDGPARQGHPHPRSLGAFPRVLGHYVRERRALSLADAIQKMTGHPAARLRLGDRGLLQVGRLADLVAFDPATVADRATFADPFRYPEGIRLVVVRGVPVLREGERTPARPGQGARPA